MGPLCFFTILMMDWRQGIELKNEVYVSILAVVLFLFMSVNMMTYFAVTNLQNFLAILERLSEVFEMEEFELIRITSTDEKDVCIKLKDASFAWGYRV